MRRTYCVRSKLMMPKRVLTQKLYFSFSWSRNVWDGNFVFETYEGANDAVGLVYIYISVDFHPRETKELVPNYDWNLKIEFQLKVARRVEKFKNLTRQA